VSRYVVAEFKTEVGLLEVEEAVCRYREAASSPSEVLSASRLNSSEFGVHEDWLSVSLRLSCGISEVI
jgi:hypothetical protein